LEGRALSCCQGLGSWLVVLPESRPPLLFIFPGFIFYKFVFLFLSILREYCVLASNYHPQIRGKFTATPGRPSPYPQQVAVSSVLFMFVACRGGRQQQQRGRQRPRAMWDVLECLTAACKALSLANAKRKGTNGLVIGSLD
jgi:hypothetical protein